MILVTGATGTVGRHVIRELQQAGYGVRALSRNPEKAKFPEGVEAVAGDLAKPDTLTAALEGVGKVFWILPNVADYEFPRIARQHGVRHIVLLSTAAVVMGAQNAIARIHMQAEQAIRDSGAAWTFLRPGAFMTNSLQWAAAIRSKGDVRVPFGDISFPDIDSRDIAAVAAKALITDGHEEKIYNLTGPESLTASERMRILGDLLGRDLGFETIPNAVAREFMLQHMPAEIVDAMIDQYRHSQDSAVLSTVEEVTGRAPITYKQWAIDHIDAFR
ncbi:SDR family oxidoreductase [Paenibacillus sp. KQZ6P-2]|uniref:SDR family oxidoreductase n=1 Tax=Paenibacillus mangrovi TaxID=2931978 RepID=A0A9X1WK80_9BACL|nr:SDR family oxidoreductase [Paenibacillus mangrovi]MCJ8010419.1 SDR family oxidoreductase [Paenibacillus mangrovi]